MPVKATNSTTLTREMYELYEQGATLAQVGERFGASKGHVSRLFKEASLKARPAGARTAEYPLQEIYAAYQDGASLQEVGERFGLSKPLVSKLFREAGLKTRPKSSVAAERAAVMYELYEQGATLEDVGDEFGITRERVRQIFKSAGLETRSLAGTGMLKKETDRQRVEEILDCFFRLKDPRSVAKELEIATATVRSVLQEHLSHGEYHTVARKPSKHNYSEEQLFEFLTQASAGHEKALSANEYSEFARDRQTADGRPWPTYQTYGKRFGSWREALLKAGLKANDSSHATNRRRFDTDRCLKAVRAVANSLGRVPTAEEYDRYARKSEGTLPSGVTVRKRCGTWIDALRMSGL